MKFIFYRYGSVCEPDMIEGLQRLGHEVMTIDKEITQKDISPEEVVTIVSSFLMKEHCDGLISVNYYPVLSEVCNIFKVLYISWTVDSPVVELLSDTITNEYNRMFIFDYEQYSGIVSYNPQRIFYLPLATNCDRWDLVISNATDLEKEKWKSEISFVGSLYTEKCPYDDLNNPSDYLKGYLAGIMEAQKKVYGYFFLNELLSEKIIKEFIQHMPNYYIPPERARRDDCLVIALKYLGYKVSSMERIEIMKMLGEKYPVKLYSGSDSLGLPVQNCGRVKTLTEMPLVFHGSKVNLNITCKSIRSGISQRVWDVMGCGGFMLTNYQNEIPEYFEVGTELETYGSLEELLEKTEYYLQHDELRCDIARKGYEKVKKYHNYTNRIEKMLKLAYYN